jgi:ABC-type multidrug transport system fused ATPase/permease subunit
MIVAEYTFGQGLLTVLAVFVFVAWIMVLFTILSDLFRDHGLSGWGKAAWVLFLIFIPFLAALIYLIARGGGMRERSIAQQQEAKEQLDAYVRETAGGSGADELAKLSDLRDKGAISDEEFQRAKDKLLT